MWARHFETFLGIWLLISWLIFGYRDPNLMAFDFTMGLLIGFLALCSYLSKWSSLHLFNFYLGLWLIAINWIFPLPHDPSQNYMVIGCLLLMISLVPSWEERPPKRWIEFMEKRQKKFAKD